MDAALLPERLDDLLGFAGSFEEGTGDREVEGGLGASALERIVETRVTDQHEHHRRERDGHDGGHQDDHQHEPARRSASSGHSAPARSSR